MHGVYIGTLWYPYTPRYTGGVYPTAPDNHRVSGLHAVRPDVSAGSRVSKPCLVPTHRAGLLGVLGAGRSTLGVRPGWSKRP